MAKKGWRWLAGILTGGLSEIPIRSYEKAKNSMDGPVQTKQRIDNLIADSGLSVQEFFQLHPELQKEYFEAENYGKGLIEDTLTSAKDNNILSAAKDAYKGSALEKNIDKITDNITGDRDIAENEKNRTFQHDEAEINRQWQAEQAQIAREWDSIGAQMERAAAAGVNPVSIAMQNGGINGSLGTSIPSAPSTPVGSSGLMHSGALDIASMVFNGIGTLAENRLKQTQADDITIMRQYNVAKSIAETDHLRKLCSGVDLSNTAQTIQNSWLDVMNQASYDGMLLENGVRRSTILEKRSIASLNFQQIESVRQSMDLALKEFNAKLPLELQLMESEISNTKMSTQDIYSEICMRFLQSIEQENRNRQSASEAESAKIEASIAKQTMEDAISSFHNSMLKGAADAGISLNDYMYWSVISHNPTEAAGKAMLQFKDLNNKRKNFRRKLFGLNEVPYYDIGERSSEMVSW